MEEISLPCKCNTNHTFSKVSIVPWNILHLLKYRGTKWGYAHCSAIHEELKLTHCYLIFTSPTKGVVIARRRRRCRNLKGWRRRNMKSGGTNDFWNFPSRPPSIALFEQNRTEHPYSEGKLRTCTSLILQHWASQPPKRRRCRKHQTELFVSVSLSPAMPFQYPPPLPYLHWRNFILAQRE